MTSAFFFFNLLCGQLSRTILEFIPKKILELEFHEGYYFKIYFVWIFVLRLWGVDSDQCGADSNQNMPSPKDVSMLFKSMIMPLALPYYHHLLYYVSMHVAKLYPHIHHIHPKWKIMLIVYDIRSKLFYWSKLFSKGFSWSKLLDKKNLD